MNAQGRLAQYLERYTLSDSRKAAQLVLNADVPVFRHTLCVPVYDEPLQAITDLIRPPVTDGVLVVLVINAPEDAPPGPLASTRSLLNKLVELGHGIARSHHAWLRQVNRDGATSHVLVLDHCTQDRCLPPHEGVGRARKLGADTALELWSNDLVESPWLFQTDADATLEDHYFDTPSHLEHSAAIHLNFRHVAPQGTSLAQQLYDLKLDTYVAGLASAGSPYAHYSLGSAMVIHSDAYVAVRGYPRRSAGEDFYLLNKLAKHGDVAFDASRTVSLRERQSTRVPFGTGPGVRRFDQTQAPLEEQAFYHPRCFKDLKTWLDFLTAYATEPLPAAPIDSRAAFVRWAGINQQTLIGALSALKLFEWLDALLLKNRSVAQAQHQINLGMDALKTLQLVHALRDEGHSNIAGPQALQWLERLMETHALNTRAFDYDAIVTVASS